MKNSSVKVLLFVYICFTICGGSKGEQRPATNNTRQHNIKIFKGVIKEAR